MAEKVVIGNAELWLGDCRDILAEVKADVIVTDPPYGISHPCNYNSRGRSKLALCNDYSDVYCDDKDFDPANILELHLPAILWGANYFSSRLPDSSGWLVWDKVRPDNLDQSTCELAWTNCIKGVRRFRHLWNGMIKASERGENYHPMQKPVALATWILSLPWIPGGVVLDPYMGAGWVGVACMKMNRRFVGCEIDPHYFDIACQRIEQAQKQARLFDNELSFSMPVEQVSFL